MSEATLAVQVESLEAQLAVLKAQVKRLIAPAPRKTFGDLYGILAGKVSSTEEEIDAVRYRFEWEDPEENTG